MVDAVAVGDDGEGIVTMLMGLRNPFERVPFQQLPIYVRTFYWLSALRNSPFSSHSIGLLLFIFRHIYDLIMLENVCIYSNTIT